MRCGLVVTTHERPAALACVLASVARQTRWPDEVLVAEDGSGQPTADVVKEFQAKARCRVRHLTQHHDGFRAGRIRNAAIAASDCEYLVLLDGDMVVHPQFLEDHLALARPGFYSQGVRILLGAGATEALLREPARLPGLLAPGLGSVRRLYSVRAPGLTTRIRGWANAVVAIKSCNQGFWRDHLLAVNGFDEAMSGWGSEDKELCARLENSGIRRQTLLWAAIAWHLHHAPAPRDSAASNRARWLDTVRTRRTRCAEGIDRNMAA